MKWQEKLVGVLTSRWTYAACVYVLIMALWSRNRGWWIAAGIAMGALTAGLLLATFPAIRQIYKAQRDFPNTPEAEEYARRKRKELENDDKNKIELK